MVRFVSFGFFQLGLYLSLQLCLSLSFPLVDYINLNTATKITTTITEKIFSLHKCIKALYLLTMTTMFYWRYIPNYNLLIDKLYSSTILPLNN